MSTYVSHSNTEFAKSLMNLSIPEIPVYSRSNYPFLELLELLEREDICDVE